MAYYPLNPNGKNQYRKSNNFQQAVCAILLAAAFVLGWRVGAAEPDKAKSPESKTSVKKAAPPAAVEEPDAADSSASDATETAEASEEAKIQAQYDVLDGTGKSGAKIDVIEWENHLEIHSYPKGHLTELSMKLDTRTKGKKVMVIGYRFKSNPSNQLVRRAILGIPFNENFKAFRDPSADDEYDKFVITIEAPKKTWIAYNLGPAPKAWEPEENTKTKPERKVAKSGKAVRTPAESTDPTTTDEPEENTKSSVDEDGTIKPFFQ